MYGIDAINHYNGWAMAIAGGLIVMTGLTVLSAVISQLHKLVALSRKKPTPPIDGEIAEDQDVVPTPFIPDTCPANIDEAAAQYQPLVDQLGGPFQLSELYELAQQYNFPHPHLTIRCLRERGILTPEGEGIFKWLRP